MIFSDIFGIYVVRVRDRIMVYYIRLLTQIDRYGQIKQLAYIHYDRWPLT